MITIKIDNQRLHRIVYSAKINIHNNVIQITDDTSEIKTALIKDIKLKFDGLVFDSIIELTESNISSYKIKDNEDIIYISKSIVMPEWVKQAFLNHSYYNSRQRMPKGYYQTYYFFDKQLRDDFIKLINEFKATKESQLFELETRFNKVEVQYNNLKRKLGR